MITLVSRFWFLQADRKAVTALEYGIIAGVLGLVLVTVFGNLGKTLSTMFANVGASM